MKSGQTLKEMLTEIQRQQTTKRDFIVNTQRIEMESDARHLRLNHEAIHQIDVDLQGDASFESFSITELCHKHLGELAEVPAKFYDKLRRDDADLLATTVNRLLPRRNSAQMVRTVDGCARAILSNRYHRLDNFQVANATLPIIADLPDARVESCALTESRMLIKVVNPRLEAEVRKGDIVQAGIVISNSEVGLGSVRVAPLVFRLVCTNGLIVNTLGSRRYHVGVEKDECWELLSEDTRRLNDAAFLMKLGDVVRSCVDEARFAMVVGRLRDAANHRLPKPVTEVVELAQDRFNFNKAETDSILQYLIEGGDLTFYGLSNAVTRAAQDAELYARATEMERIGWSVITDRRWM